MATCFQSSIDDHTLQESSCPFAFVRDKRIRVKHILSGNVVLLTIVEMAMVVIYRSRRWCSGGGCRGGGGEGGGGGGGGGTNERNVTVFSCAQTSLVPSSSNVQPWVV